MFFPKRIRRTKVFKGKINTKDYSKNATKLQYGNCGLQALENGRITPKHIEAVRRIVVRKVNKAGRLWIGIFADTPVTAKPLEIRMGKGKGSFNYWASRVRTGRVLFELIGVKKEVALEAFSLAANKLPIKTQVIIKD